MNNSEYYYYRKEKEKDKLPKCKCGENEPSKFYGSKKTHCAKCHNEYTLRKGQEKRSYAIAKLGGKCLKCGFNKHKSALDIHHLKPTIKDEHFKHMRGWSIERIDKEIEKCILLCKNCHAAFHSGELELSNISEIGKVCNPLLLES